MQKNESICDPFSREAEIGERRAAAFSEQDCDSNRPTE